MEIIRNCLILLNISIIIKSGNIVHIKKMNYNTRSRNSESLEQKAYINILSCISAYAIITTEILEVACNSDIKI